MPCKVMQELNDDAESAMRLMKRRNQDTHLAMLYAQWKLEAERMQRVHAELCQECFDDEERKA